MHLDAAERAPAAVELMRYVHATCRTQKKKHLDAAGDAGGGEELVIAVKGGGAYHVGGSETVSILEVRNHPAAKSLEVKTSCVK